MVSWGINLFTATSLILSVEGVMASQGMKGRSRYSLLFFTDDVTADTNEL